MLPSSAIGKTGGSADKLGHYLSRHNLIAKRLDSIGVTIHYHEIVTDCVKVVHSEMLRSNEYATDAQRVNTFFLLTLAGQVQFGPSSDRSAHGPNSNARLLY